MTDAMPKPPPPSPTPFWWPETRTFIVGWMCMSTFVVIVLFWWRPPEPSNQLLTSLISIYVGTGLVTAITWWMGSSKSSDDKNDTIASQLQPPSGNGLRSPIEL